ncbi:MAG: alanine--tRNA ligase, partial [Planctomycetota bacterium]
MPRAITPRTASALTTAQIRQGFIDYFVKEHGHAHVPSSPVAPHDDPTLLFTNAGMNQFKDILLGHPPQAGRDYSRVANSQKCIRAGGKHNDLEDVGKDHYHHTFFEMLGNWSFGDYFKAEAIEWAWELLTDVWQLDKDRLYVTVFAGDERENLPPDTEAEAVWKRYVATDRITRWGKKDNFWEMGATGPCGPCSEIHYDYSRDRSGGPLVNAGDERVVELWNLVFIQFNRTESGTLEPLPAKHVDTGMGLERLTRVLQGKDSNYDIDVFAPIFAAIEAHSGAHSYRGSLEDPVDIAYRVIADHVRCLTTAITDGAWPSNEGRGYVLRRILRRAVRHAHQTLRVEGPLLCDLVPAVVESLGGAFPELKDKPEKVAEVIHDEEESFLRTLDNGIRTWWSFAGYALQQRFTEEQAQRPPDERLAIALGGGGTAQEFEFYKRTKLAPFRRETTVAIERDVYTDRPIRTVEEFKLGDLTRQLARKLCKEPPEIAGNGAFMLHDTYGFPIDLTRVMAEERGLTVDETGYEALMERARQRSREAVTDKKAISLPADAIPKLHYLGAEPTLDEAKYAGRPVTARVVAIFNGRDFDNSAHIDREVAVILDRTNHYAEAGGQVGDHGEIQRETPAHGCYKVDDTQAFAGYVLHIGHTTDGELRVGDHVTVVVDHDQRSPTRANHTATHLLNYALREVVGPEEDQKGSLVAPDRLRFDFSCSHAMNDEQIEQAERMVNDAVERALAVDAAVLPLDLARSITGVRAIFGEKYPDPVRVVSIGVPLKDVTADPGNERWRGYSIELCGGTHKDQTGDIQRFLITHEQALAAGVRRITAVTGASARAADTAGRQLEERAQRAARLDDALLLDELHQIGELADELTIGALAHRRVNTLLESLQERAKTIRKARQAQVRAGAVDQARAVAADPQAVTEAAGAKVVVAALHSATSETLRSAMDVVRGKHPDAAVMLLSADNKTSKVAIFARVPDEVIKRGLKAGD